MPGYAVQAELYAITRTHQALDTMPRRDLMRPSLKRLQVLGDRSLKLKYLNPNVVLVVTGPPASLASKAEYALGTVTLTLVDTVTGRILYRQAYQVRAACLWLKNTRLLTCWYTGIR